MTVFPADAYDDDGLTAVATWGRVLVCTGCGEAEAVRDCESCGDQLCLGCWGEGDIFCDACLGEGAASRPIDVEVEEGYL